MLSCRNVVHILCGFDHHIIMNNAQLRVCGVDMEKLRISTDLSFFLFDCKKLNCFKVR